MGKKRNKTPKATKPTKVCHCDCHERICSHKNSPRWPKHSVSKTGHVK